MSEPRGGRDLRVEKVAAKSVFSARSGCLMRKGRPQGVPLFSCKITRKERAESSANLGLRQVSQRLRRTDTPKIVNQQDWLSGMRLSPSQNRWSVR